MKYNLVAIIVALMLMTLAIFEADFAEGCAWLAVALVLYRYLKLLKACRKNSIEEYIWDELDKQVQEEFETQAFHGNKKKSRTVTKIITEKEMIEWIADPTEEELVSWGFSLNHPIISTKDSIQGYFIISQEIPEERE